MQAMAAFPGSTRPTLVEVSEPPPPGQGEVLCRTLQLGVCGTDREILKNTRPVLPEGDDFLALGHECLARVEALGDGVQGVAVGDLVVPVVRRPLPGTTLRPDLLAFGEYVERGIVSEHGFSLPLWLDRPEFLVPVPPAAVDLAVLTEPQSVAEKGINEALLLQQARVSPETWTETPPRVLVTGMGPIGFAGIIGSVARGWPVTLYGRDPQDSFRALLAEELGASYRPAEEWESGPGDVEAEGFDLMLECTGHDGVMMTTAGWLAARGVMVWLGGLHRPEPVPHDVAAMMWLGFLRNHIFLGSVNAAERDFRDALDHLAQLQQTHAEALKKMVTSRISLDEAEWHYVNREPQGVKVVIDYE